MTHETTTSGASTVLGYPRIGTAREVKRALEAYWSGRGSAAEVTAVAAEVRRSSWAAMSRAGISEVPCNDFSLYDHVLDAARLVGAVPDRHRVDVTGLSADEAALRQVTAMARGTEAAAPLEMTKWFDTNYHYLVPEIGPDTVFALDAGKPLGELAEAAALGLAARPVVVGPVTFLQLAKPAGPHPDEFTPLARLDDLVEVYVELLAALGAAGDEWVQLDEPCLVLDQAPDTLAAVARTYDRLAAATTRPKLLVATYFGHVGDAMPMLRAAPVEGVALDFTGPGRANLELAAAGGLPGKRLVAGVVDGRNVWVADLRRSLSTLGTLLGLADEVVAAPSCSLLHVPLDAAREKGLDPQLSSWLSFAAQKLVETATLARGLAEGTDAIQADLAANQSALDARRASTVARDDAVRERVAAVGEDDVRRRSTYPVRAAAQHERLDLPRLPTTTIGSFPQTSALRQLRAALRSGSVSEETYRSRMTDEIDRLVSLQEDLGLDVLVHGEPERNDMVQYFAEQLAGFVTTGHGWVQSYGTRYVRPPLLVGDVSRASPMTVQWATYAQGRTSRPVKGMLTGPVTMLSWSFVRDDQPLADTARQVAVALRDEVGDLEAAGIAVIQVDEPALREGLPLRRAEWDAYLRWATAAFRLATSGVRDDTQIHTHMCYSEFGDVLAAIVDLDADVVSLEAARSGMAVVHELAAVAYPAAVGPGVYDIHSPRVPAESEIADLLDRALSVLPARQVWVNPDCGLKTRTEDEVLPSLTNLVNATRAARERLAVDDPAIR